MATYRTGKSFLLIICLMRDLLLEYLKNFYSSVTKKANTPDVKWAMDKNRHFSPRGYKQHVKISPTPGAIRRMRINTTDISLHAPEVGSN